MGLLVDAGPIFVGANHRPFYFTWTDDSGAAIDLTSATLSLKLKNHATGAVTAGTGTFTDQGFSGGKFSYKAALADLAVSGNYEVQVTATWGTEKELADKFILPIVDPI